MRLTPWRCAVLLCLFARALPAGPVAEVEIATVDLGRLSVRAPVDQLFAVRNAGDEDLEIKVEKTSCGCLSYVTGAMVVPPGARAEVALRVRPDKGRNLGPNSYHAELSTNDPDRPHIDLSFSVDFRASIEVSPNVLDFGAVTRGDAPSRTLVVTLFDGGASGPLTLDCSAGHISAREIASETHGGSRESTWAVELRSGGANAGTLRDEIVVRSASPDRPAVRVPVRAEIKGPLAASPERIIVPSMAPGELIEARVKIWSSDGLPRGPLSAVCSDARVRVEISQSGPATWDLAARIRAPEAAEYIKTNILVIDNNGETLLSTPFRALVRTALE